MIVLLGVTKTLGENNRKGFTLYKKGVAFYKHVGVLYFSYIESISESISVSVLSFLLH